VSVLCRAERAHGAGTILVVTTAEEMTHGTDTRIGGVNEDVYSLGISTSRAASWSSVLYVYHLVLENPAPPSRRPSIVSYKIRPVG